MRFRESFRRFGKNQSGAIGAEFAIVGTLFCVLMFVMIQMGMVAYSFSVMQNGARDGARQLAVDNDTYPFDPGEAMDCASPDAVYDKKNNPTAEAYTCSLMQLFADAKVTACITLDSGARYDAEVVVTANMADVGMFDLFGVANGVQVTANAVMRVEDGKMANLIDNTGPFCSTSIPLVPS